MKETTPITAPVLAMILAGSLAGCGQRGMEDLQKFVSEAHKDRRPQIEPLPRIRSYEIFNYSAENLVDPFSAANLQQDKPVAAAGGGPDPNRRKEALEQFPLDSLRMVGTLFQSGTWWVVVQAPDGTVHRAALGNYLGQNYGRITQINEERVELTELVAGSSGEWVERPSNMTVVQ
jgi:type IV pilus assembly protein PilP